MDKTIEKNVQLFKFIRYASMNVMGMLSVSCYILADTFFISKGMGTNGLAALNLAIPVFGFTTGSGLMFGMGGATKYSVAMGKEQSEESRAVFTNTLILAAAAALIFFSAGVFFSGEIAQLMGANEEIFDMTYTYIRTILLFSPAFILNHVMQCFVRNDGSPQIAMIAMVSGSLSNIALDYVFIFPLNMGIFGAAIATCFAPIISLFVLCFHLFSHRSGLKPCKIKISFNRTKDTVFLGFPSLVTEISSSVVIIVYNLIIMDIAGNVGVAAYGVIANLSLVVVSMYTGIAQGAQPLLSFAYGQGDVISRKKFLRYALITAECMSIIIYVTIFIFADPVAGIFNSENDAMLQTIAVPGLKLYFTAVFFVGFNIILSVYFTSVEKGLPAQIISLSRGLILIIPMAFLLSSLFGITGVWLSLTATEVLVSIGALIFKKREKF